MSKTIKVKYKVSDPKYKPEFSYGDDESSCMDLKARIEPDEMGKMRPVEMFPGQTLTFATGLFLELPPGTEALVRPRSGLANEMGLTVLNSPGTIDPGYRGEVKVVLHFAKTTIVGGWGHPSKNNRQVVIEDGMRIAQLAIRETPKIKLIEIEEDKELSATTRGAKGFGSSGK
jgi:dUTP pyrophosphatase